MKAWEGRGKLESQESRAGEKVAVAVVVAG